jgi:hypothetical protein
MSTRPYAQFEPKVHVNSAYDVETMAALREAARRAGSVPSRYAVECVKRQLELERQTATTAGPRETKSA